VLVGAHTLVVPQQSRQFPSRPPQNQASTTTRPGSNRTARIHTPSNRRSLENAAVTRTSSSLASRLTFDSQQPARRGRRRVATSPQPPKTSDSPENPAQPGRSRAELTTSTPRAPDYGDAVRTVAWSRPWASSVSRTHGTSAGPGTARRRLRQPGAGAPQVGPPEAALELDSVEQPWWLSAGAPWRSSPRLVGGMLGGEERFDRGIPAPGKAAAPPPPPAGTLGARVVLVSEDQPNVLHPPGALQAGRTPRPHTRGPHCGVVTWSSLETVPRVRRMLPGHPPQRP
jgi:hypothetical protein